MNKTLAALVLGAGILGAGCREFKPETGRIFDINVYYGKPSFVETTTRAAGWDYAVCDYKGYGKNSAPCEQLSMPIKDTLLFPVYGVKEGMVVSGEMCCVGDVSEGNFWMEYCILLEDKAEMP